ncbi:MAG: EF-hand domain-containing protein, partial [Planctomycetota bacterium]
MDRRTGETVWEQARPLFKAGWSTPMIWRHGGTDEIIVLGFRRLTSYDPSTGAETWWAGGFSPETIGVPVAGGGLLFVSAAAMAGRGEEEWDAPRTWKITLERFDRNKDGRIQRDEMTRGFTIILRPELSTDNPGFGLPIRDMDGLMRFFDKDKDRVITEGEWLKTMSGFSKESEPALLAFRPGAKGDARKSHVEWEVHSGVPECPSLLHRSGKLYLLRDGGWLSCLEAATGRQIFRERIGASGNYIASPVAAGDKIIAASARGTVHTGRRQAAGARPEQLQGEDPRHPRPRRGQDLHPDGQASVRHRRVALAGGCRHRRPFPVPRRLRGARPRPQPAGDRGAAPTEARLHRVRGGHSSSTLRRSKIARVCVPVLPGLLSSISAIRLYWSTYEPVAQTQTKHLKRRTVCGISVIGGGEGRDVAYNFVPC